MNKRLIILTVITLGTLSSCFRWGETQISPPTSIPSSNTTLPPIIASVVPSLPPSVQVNNFIQDDNFALEFSPGSKGVVSFSPVSKGINEFSPTSKGVYEFSPGSKGVYEFSPDSKGVTNFAPSSKGVLAFSPSSKGITSLLPTNDSLTFSPSSKGISNLRFNIDFSGFLIREDFEGFNTKAENLKLSNIKIILEKNNEEVFNATVFPKYISSLFRVDFDSEKFLNLEEYKIKVFANTYNKLFFESSLVKIENNTQVKIKIHSHNMSPEDLDIEIKTRVLK
ncbi:MAG: hypothetical protein AABZ74_15645 [Cyanobacteriota bacterium]